MNANVGGGNINYGFEMSEFNDKESNMSPCGSPQVMNEPTRDGAEMSNAQLTTNQAQMNLYSPLVDAFSLLSAGKHLLNTDQSEDDFSSLHGIRVLSMFWIILLHTHLYMITAMDNYFEAFKRSTSFLYQILTNGDVAVDTFFLMSGILVTYWTIKRLQTRGNCGDWWFWTRFYLHRWWRLAPLYGFVILIACTLLIRMAKGPLYALPQMTLDMCKRNWWTNLLFINNFYPTEGQEKCLSWSWYLAVDVQCYIVSPLFILLLHTRKRLGIALVLAAIAGSIVLTGLLSAHYGLPVTAFGRPSKNTTDAAVDYIYEKPWTRCPPFLLGMLLGYTFTCMKTRKLKINMAVVVANWFISAALMLAVLFGLYDHYQNPGAQHNEAVKAIYNACHRCAWSIGVAWIAFACETGNGGAVELFLKWRAWKPLSRVSYVVYILHPALLLVYYSTRPVTMHYDDWPMLYNYAGILVFSYLVCTLLYLAVELPLYRIVKTVPFTMNILTARGPARPRTIAPSTLILCPCHNEVIIKCAQIKNNAALRVLSL
ncbi:PREDICTED: nose resistant to fluoxetine protein 6-like [Priapulus caudatus]|uniref:Nose resistant to fluoxetine protein 6-like n=1 Tax=Priapulus caudatus TaxID=37621 RepID=A0ABM1EE60_PRICU|nr:PREDICTED: nose resistant to fluoxetine protein 6-like [Priapulus caudatus]